MVLSCNMFYRCFEKLLHKNYNNIQIYHKEVSTNQVRLYHYFLVKIIVKSVNLTQMSKQKIFITMMANN